MIKREAKLQVRFGHWLKAVYMERYAMGAFELKYCVGDSLPFSAVKAHQIAALVAVKHGKFYYKIPDDSMGAKPYDCFCMSRGDAYVVIEYSVAGFFCLIDIDVFVAEQKRSARKSLTSARARAIAAWVVD